MDFLVSEGACEVFLIGTSRGTLSAAYLASVMTHANVEGYVPHRESGGCRVLYGENQAPRPDGASRGR